MFKQGDKVKLKRDIYRWTHQEQPRQNVLYAREGEVGEIIELFLSDDSRTVKGMKARWNAKVLIENQIKTFRLSSIEKV